MDFKAAAIAATAAGSILLTGVVFTGSVSLADIKNIGFGWADKISQAVDETKEMAAKFDLFKSDVEAQLNEKIAKVNELNAKIADLVAKVGAGEVNLEAANNEIARLNEQLEQANAEVEALKAEYQLKDSEVTAAFAEMETAENMDTTMTLATQNPDTVVPEGTEAPEEPAAPEEPVNDYAAQETAVHDAMKLKYSMLGTITLTVTMTDNSITLSGTSIYNKYDYASSTVLTDIGTAAGVTVTGVTKVDNNTIKYTY